MKIQIKAIKLDHLWACSPVLLTLAWIISNEPLGRNQKSNQGLICFTILLQDSMFILIILKTRNPSWKLALNCCCCDSENKNKRRNKPMNSIKTSRYCHIPLFYPPCLPLDLGNKQRLDRESQNHPRIMEWDGLGGTLKPTQFQPLPWAFHWARSRGEEAQEGLSTGIPFQRFSRRKDVALRPGHRCLWTFLHENYIPYILTTKTWL